MNLNIPSFLLGLATGSLFVFMFFSLMKKAYRPKQEIKNVIANERVDLHVTIEIIERSKDGLPVAQWFPLPIPWKRMVELAKRIQVNGNQFNYTLCGIEAGNPVTRGQLDSLRDIFLEKSLLKERTPGARRSGFEITRAGKIFFAQWASYPPLEEDELIEWARSHQTQSHTDTTPTT